MYSLTMDVEPLPKALVQVMNNVLQDEKCLWWRIHGLPDKIAMNVMWSLGPSRHGSGSTPCTSSSSGSGYSDQAIQTDDVNLATGTKDFEVEEEEASVRPRGERRKQLPSIPDSKTLNAMANTVNNKPATAHKGGSGYSIFFLEYTLMAEYNKLHKQKLPGVYVIPSALTPLVWNGVLFIRQGQYQDGVFKFTVNIPENFPHGECPRVIFEFPVFHPVVDPHTGELDVKRAFPKWRPKVHEIWQVLLYTRRIFYKIDTKSPSNEEAAQLYEQDMEQFKKKVTETVQKSKDLLYSVDKSQDPHSIIFSLWDPEVHEEARRQMLNSKVKSTENNPK